MEELRQNVDIKKIFGLRYDPLFKHFYLKKQNMKRLFKDLFHEKLEDFSYDNREFSKGNIHLRCGYSDMILRTKNRIILLEIQNSDLKNFPIRLKKYISTLYVNQETDKYYSNMLPVEAYVILNYKAGKQKVLKEFSELERELQEEFDHLSRIKVWNIKEALENMESIDYHYARLFGLDEYQKEEAIQVLEEERKNEYFKPLVQSIILYNMDAENYRKLEEIKMFETTFELETSMLREYAEKEGERRGFLRGEKRGQKVGQRIGEKRGQKIGQKIGEKIGEERGEKKGEIRGKLLTAKNLLAEGVPLELIVKVTDLSAEQIKEYARI